MSSFFDQDVLVTSCPGVSSTPTAVNGNAFTGCVQTQPVLHVRLSGAVYTEDRSFAAVSTEEPTTVYTEGSITASISGPELDVSYPPKHLDIGGAEVDNSLLAFHYESDPIPYISKCTYAVLEKVENDQFINVMITNSATACEKYWATAVDTVEVG